jgi:CRISPR-associated endonuclease/helicase Cas3
VATTVGRAQELRRRIAVHVEREPELLHGRFHAEDRAIKERAILTARGRNAERKESVILVATQVVEVSLNIDFDTLYSDPGPLEALVQRFGRVNRFCGPVRPVHICRDIPEGSPVYREPIVKAAIGALEQVDGLELDEAHVETMLDRIYNAMPGTDLDGEIVAAMERFGKEVLGTCRPFTSDERIEGLFDELFDGYEVLPSCFEAEYHRRIEQQPLLAPGLLVPITRGQYWKLRRSGRLRKHEHVLIANCRYGSDGLEIDAPADQDGV